MRVRNRCFVVCAVVAGLGIVVACSESGTPSSSIVAPRADVKAPSGATVEQSLISDLRDPASAVYTSAAENQARLEKAYADVPGLREKLQAISQELASAHGVSQSNPRLQSGALHLADVAAAPGNAAAPRCAAAVGMAASYAYTWSCRQCVSGETVCAYAYAYAYAWAFAWVCQNDNACGAVDGGARGDAGAMDASYFDGAVPPQDAGPF